MYKGKENILIVRFGTLGDSIWASTFIRELRSSKNNANIDFLTDNITYQIMKNCPYINNFIFVDKKLKSIVRNIKTFSKYNTIYFLKNDCYYTRIAFLANIKNRIGFNVRRNKLLTQKVEYNEDKHEHECYLDLLRINNIPINNKDIEVYTNNKALKNIENITKNIKNPIVIIQAFSRFREKDWINKHWQIVIKHLSDELQLQVICLGNKKNYNQYQEILTDLKELKLPPINLSGKISVTESIELIKKSTLVISIDSAVIHMAAALKKDSILLHGPTSLTRWKPLNNNCTIISENYDCSPCFLQSGKKNLCKGSAAKCMLNLSPTKVIEQVNKKLAITKE